MTNLLTTSSPAARWCAALILLLGLAVAPSRAEIVVVGGLSRESTLRPGGKTEGRILLHNVGQQDQQARIYQTDYQFWSDGRNEYGEPGSTPRSNAKWLTVTPSQLLVPAGGTESIYYTLQLPADDKLAGTYWSMLMIEPLAPETLEPPKPEAGKAQVGLRTVVRYGLQMATHIGETGTRQLRFIDRQLLLTPDHHPVLQLDAENAGERLLVPQLWVELYDAQGALIGRFEAGKFRIYHGCSVRYRVDLANVPRGRYKALVVADNGDDHVFGAQYDLELP